MGGESVLDAPVVVIRRHYSCFMQSKCAPQFARRLNMESWGICSVGGVKVLGVPRYFAGADKRLVMGCPICHWCNSC